MRESAEIRGLSEAKQQMSLSCTIQVKVVPNASRNQTVEWLGNVLKVKVNAPALEGRANDMLCEFLAGELALPRRNVALLQGERSRQKVVRIDGLSAEEVRDRLACHPHAKQENARRF